MIAAPPRARPPAATSVLPRRRLTRLRAILVAGLGVVALLGLSLLSMEVAAARTRLADLDRRIADSRRGYALLATEFSIRSRPDALLRWGATSRALAPPRVHQYLPGLGQLQALGRPVPDDREIASR